MEGSLTEITGAEYIASGSWSAATGAPKQRRLKEIGEEEEEQDEADGQHVHEQQQYDAAMVEIPAGRHAAEGIEHAEHRECRRNDKQQRGAGVGEIREPERGGEAEEYQQIAAKQRPAAEIETAKDERERVMRDVPA
jgi:hypothetical protein